MKNIINNIKKAFSKKYRVLVYNVEFNYWEEVIRNVDKAYVNHYLNHNTGNIKIEKHI